MSDFRQQEELEAWRLHQALSLLETAQLRRLTDAELSDLASELGVGREWRQLTERRAA